MDFYDLKVSHIEQLTEDSVRVDLFPVRYGDVDFSYKAGQYLTLETEIDGKTVRRSYSICSSPDSHQLSVGIKKVHEGIFSTFANDTLKVGDILRSMKPMGNFINKDDGEEGKSFVYIAAGSGITPILSMMKATLESSSSSIVSLFYGNKNARSIMFHEEIEALKNTYLGRVKLFNILSRQPQDAEIFNGRIDSNKVQEWKDTCMFIDSTDAFFLCGPESMILDVKSALEAEGVQKESIHFELFTSNEGVVARAKRKETKSENNKQVQIILDGKAMKFDFTDDDDNVLDKALQMGADLPYACKGGVCCTCKAKLVEGDVDMYVNYGLEEDEIDRGFILTCQAYPKSDSIVVDFDEV